MIALTDVSHRIGKNLIVQDVNLTIKPGQVTALIGPNGAGKSTLLNLIAGQETLQTGQITLDGEVTKAMDPRQMALKMAVVAQHVGVASRLRVKDLIGFGRWPHNQGRPTDIDHKKISQALAQFDLNALTHRFLDEISGGQRQRAFVAMAYAQDTDWLLLDEPLNNLDLRHARALMAELHQMARIQGKSIVIVLHDLNYAVAWADHIIAMKDGQIVLDGPTGQTATTDAFSALYDTEVTVHETGGKLFVAHHN